ncbi:MAG: choice-of-anchor E domain-containing protein [Patescibacteria group bacterium]
MTTIFSQTKVGKNFAASHLIKRAGGFLFIFIFSFSLIVPNISSAQSVDLPGTPYVMAGTGSCASGANKIKLSFAQDTLGPATDYYLSRSPFSGGDSGWGDIQHVTDLNDFSPIDSTFAHGAMFSYQVVAVGPGGNRYSPIISANTLPIESRQITQTINFSAATNNWLAHATLNYFDPSLGTLTALEIAPTSIVKINQKVENTANHTISVGGSSLATSTFTLPGHTSKSYFANSFAPVAITAFDGALDYVGSSSFTNGTTTYNQAAPVITIVDPTELSNYISASAGGIDVTQDVSTSATSFAESSPYGTGPFSHFPLTQTTSSAVVTYTYTNALCNNPAISFSSAPIVIPPGDSSNIKWDPVSTTSYAPSHVAWCYSPVNTGGSQIPSFYNSGGVAYPPSATTADGDEWVTPASTKIYGITCFSSDPALGLAGAGNEFVTGTVLVQVVDKPGEPHVTATTSSCGAGAGKISLSFVQDSGGPVTDYYLKRDPYSVPDSSPSSGWGDILHVTSFAALPATDSGLTPGGSYQYQILARGPGGDSWSDLPASLTAASSACLPLFVHCSAAQPLGGVDLQSVPPDTVIWTATPEGGSLSYTYLWTGDAPLNGNTTAGISLNYAGTLAGQKYGFVTVTDTSSPPLFYGPIACGSVNVTDSNANFNLTTSATTASLKFINEGAVSTPVRITISPEPGFVGNVTISAPASVVVGGVTMNVRLYRHGTQALVTSPVSVSQAQFSDGLDMVLIASKPVPAASYPNVLTINGVSGAKSDSKAISLDASLSKPIFEEF